MKQTKKKAVLRLRQNAADVYKTLFFMKSLDCCLTGSYQSLERSNLKADEIMTSQLRVTELQPQ